MHLRFLHRAFKARFRSQKHEIRALQFALEPNQVAVDIGANKGSYTYWLSRAVPGGHVVAIEPQPRLADYLRRACAAAGLNNVTVESAGVSDRQGTMTLHIPGDGDSPGASLESAVQARERTRSLQVPVLSLDEYFSGCRSRIGAIKADVEGHELAVFRGAERVLAEHGPLLVFECESRHMAQGSVPGVLEYLKKRKYTGFFVHRSGLIPVAQFRPELHQNTRAGGRKDYCNNFIMTKSA